jgi:uncharacterized protein (TIGR02646 family)
MIYINKGKEPHSLSEYRSSNINVSYDNIPTDVKDDVRNSLLQEQGFICAYCMSRITEKNVNIEHYIAQNPPQNHDKSLDLAYSNMLGVCPGNEGQPIKQQTCDRHRKNIPLTVNPLDSASVSRIEYSADGSIKSTDATINADLNETLNLNIDFLKRNRKDALDELKRKLHSRKETGDWKPLAIRYIKKLNEEQRKQPYCGILLWYLAKKVG